MLHSTTAIASFPGGQVHVSGDDDGSTTLHVQVCDAWLTDGLHGFHVHEWGDRSNGCTSMGSHYNPDHTQHGSTTSEERHGGDLGNVIAKDGCIDQTIYVKDLDIKEIVGRGIVIHEKADDMGLGSNEESKRTGNAGGRLLCAPIAWSRS